MNVCINHRFILLQPLNKRSVDDYPRYHAKPRTLSLRSTPEDPCFSCLRTSVHCYNIVILVSSFLLAVHRFNLITIRELHSSTLYMDFISTAEPHSSVGSVADWKTEGRWFDPRGLMIVIVTGFIPLSPLSVV